MKKKMNTKWKMLTLAAMLSATTTSASAGDLNGGGVYDEDAYFGESRSYAETLYEANDSSSSASSSGVAGDSYIEDNRGQAEAYVGDFYDNQLEPVAYVGDQPMSGHRSIGSGVPVHTASHGTGYEMQGYDTDCGCGSTSCGGGCATSACAPTRRHAKRTMLSNTDAWLTAEALLWFPQVRSTPPLVATGAAGVRPELDQGATVVYGGQDAFGGELQAGFRLDGGFMLSEDFGVGGRFWMLGESEDSFNGGGNGSTESIGVPFFDTDLTVNPENSVLVGFTDGGALPDFEGTVSSRSSLDVYGAEAYGKLRLLEGKGYRADFIGGFSHFGIDEQFGLTVNAVQTDNAGGNGGLDDVFNFTDDLEVENRFYGGQLGFLTEVGRGAWTLTALTKVHLGDMEQTLTNRGSRTFSAAGGPVTGSQANGGILGVGLENSTTNEFAFAPEANLKLSFKMRPHVRFSVGYSFIMWNDVLSIGDNLNRNINTGALTPDGAGVYDALQAPAFQGLVSDSFFVHGLDLGAVIEF